MLRHIAKGCNNDIRLASLRGFSAWASVDPANLSKDNPGKASNIGERINTHFVCLLECVCSSSDKED